MAVLGGAYDDFDSAFNALKAKIESGDAIDKFKEFIRIQAIRDRRSSGITPQAKNHIEIKRHLQDITSIDAESIGIICI